MFPIKEDVTTEKFKWASNKILWIISTITIIILFIVFWGILRNVYSNRNIVTKLKIPQIEMTRNNLYRSDESLQIFNEKSSLPDWLDIRKEVVFPKQSIVKGKHLGEGQFGTVFKGKLHQGNAV